VIGSIVEPFFAELTRTIVHDVRERGYSVIMADNEYRDDVEAAHLRNFAGNRVAGLILRSAYGDGNLDYVLRMRRRGVAVVEVDYFVPGQPAVARHARQRGRRRGGRRPPRRHGHRRIARSVHYHRERNADERVQTFPKALARHGLPLPRAYQRQVAHRVGRPRRDARPHAARRAADGHLRHHRLHGHRRLPGPHGARLPRPPRREPAGVRRLPLDAAGDPGIDTLAQPVEAMGQAAVRLLFEQMRPGRRAPWSACASPPS
jgi:LacI family transcriptional regulator